MKSLDASVLLVLCFCVIGCQQPPPPLAPPKPPEVIVTPAVVQQVSDYEEFTGRLEAFQAVEVRARVTGYLQSVHFQEGDTVRKNQVLFKIDPALLKAERDRSQANLEQALARVKRLEADQKRMASLPAGTVSPQEIDRIMGDLAEAEAAVKSAEAARYAAEVNLGYTEVVAPISGRIGRRLVDPGNIVKADETALTYIADLDRVYVYFDVDERTYLQLARLLESRGQANLAAIRDMPVWMGLVDEQGFPRQGKLNFVDSRVDPNTGSVWVRGEFENSDRLLTPGLFVRIRIRLGSPRPALLIPERALGTDQGQKFVYVIEEVPADSGLEGTAPKYVARYRSVELGSKQGLMVEIKKGLSVGERVIVSGLQRVRSGAAIDIREEAPPLNGASAKK
jgi:RND family efflux transporter MFP subunit